MTDLGVFISKMNVWRKLRGKSLLNANHLKEEEAKEIAYEIHMALEPENLTCDGELSQREVRIKFNELNRALSELGEMGFDISCDW